MDALTPHTANAPIDIALLKARAPAPFDIDAHLDSYPYDPTRMNGVHQVIRAKMKTFDQPYGDYMIDHLNWVAATFGKALKRIGFNDNVIGNAMQAVLDHDGGKLLQRGLWRFTDTKPTVSKEERNQKNEHVWLFLPVYDAAVRESGLVYNDDNAKAVESAKYFAVYHHDRLNGSGPNELPASSNGRVLRILAIVDAFHGKLKAKSAEAAIEEMRNSAKHAGEFDLGIMDAITPILLQSAAQPRPATAPVP